MLKRSTRRDDIAPTRRSTERDSAPMSEGTVILALGEVTGCFPFSGAPILRRAQPADRAGASLAASRETAILKVTSIPRAILAQGAGVRPVRNRPRLCAALGPGSRWRARDMGGDVHPWRRVSRGRRAVRLCSACRPPGAEEAKRAADQRRLSLGGRSTPRYRRRPTQQLRQLGEVHRQPPRLVARQPIWSAIGATQRFKHTPRAFASRPIRTYRTLDN